MPDLLRFQAAFATALRDRDLAVDTMRPWLAGGDALLARRLGIHRATMQAAAEKALAEAYPVIRQAVGGEFFDALARAYQHAWPSTSGDLGEFGANVARFLANFEHVRHLPWLSDLARLEWAAHLAYGAADGAAWDPSALAQVDDDAQAALRFAWAPGTAVVESPWPVVRVWTIHQAGAEDHFDVDWTVPETALVAREGFSVSVTRLAPGDAAFVRASLQGATLGDAADAALRADPEFDLGALLGRAFAAGLVCGHALA